MPGGGTASAPEQNRPPSREGCPDENEIVDFLQGSLSLAGRARLESHCASCERCREALRAAASDLVPIGSSASGSMEPALQREIASTVRGLLDDASHPGAELPAGGRIGRFEVLAMLGRGQFGVVYRAELGRLVAIKMIRRWGRTGVRAPELVEALLRTEAAAAARLQHPNIVTLHDCGVFDGAPYLVLELLEGEPLRDLIERGVRIGPREALAIASDVTRGLVEAHAAGVIHRDIKPGNVFVCSSGQVKILDFGLARLADTVDAQAAAQTAQAGTPRYMAPELFGGHPADACSDVYAVGVTLLDLLAGAPPAPDRTAIAERIDRTPISPRLRRLLHAATAARRDERIQSAGKLLTELTGFQRELAAPARTRERRILAVALACVLCAAVAVVAYRSRASARRSERSLIQSSGNNGSAARNPCRLVTHTNNGMYCGTSTQGGFSPRHAAPNVLYDCVDGQVASRTRCPAECIQAAPGLPDSCTEDDPCANVRREQSGVYCGHSTQKGFAGDVRRSQYLLTCSNGTMVDGTRCGTRCTSERAGTPDHCDPDPCAGVSHEDNGTYCGTSSSHGFDPQNGSLFVLYTCIDGHTNSAAFCRHGCVTGMTGVADHCN